MRYAPVALNRDVDLRLVALRREVFHRFYTFQLRHKAHPGCVYFLLPWLAGYYGWDPEQRAWAAWINGNTQNPVTTLLLMMEGPSPAWSEAMLTYWRSNASRLEWDTDRRRQKYQFDRYTQGYLRRTGGDAVAYWQAASAEGWRGCWRAATALPGMGRLSAWSYLEYLRLLKVADIPDADTLMLDDMEGSRSHRNGLCLVLGLDEFISDEKLRPGSAGMIYSQLVLDWLAREGNSLLLEARQRNPGEEDVSYLTLESALCTYKSWHKVNRRYPGVYADMLYNRIKYAERQGQHEQLLDPIWDARLDCLPPYLRLEDNPGDPGLHPTKQNWYLETGQAVMLGRLWPELWSDFDQGVEEERWGRFR